MPAAPAPVAPAAPAPAPCRSKSLSKTEKAFRKFQVDVSKQIHDLDVQLKRSQTRPKKATPPPALVLTAAPCASPAKPCKKADHASFMALLSKAIKAQSF